MYRKQIKFQECEAYREILMRSFIDLVDSFSEYIGEVKTEREPDIDELGVVDVFDRMRNGFIEFDRLFMAVYSKNRK